MDDETPRLRDVTNELRTPGYLKRTQERAQRRRSPWNLLLIPFFTLGGGGSAYLLFQAMWRIHLLFYPEHAGRVTEFWRSGLSFRSFVSSFLLLMPLLFASVPIGLILANALAWCVSPARRAFEREAEGVKWASFGQSMHGLWLMARLVVPACFLLSFIGAATLKNLR